MRSVLTEAQFDELFPEKTEDYSYQGLLSAVSFFPAFCGEMGDLAEAASLTVKENCRKELAAFLAFAIYDSNRMDEENYNSDEDLVKQGGYISQDPYCYVQGGGFREDQCNFFEWGIQDEINPITSSAVTVDEGQYYGRGAYQLIGNSEYGRLGRKMYYTQIVAVQKGFLNSPSSIATADFTFIPLMDWYLSYQNYKPSCHDVIAGFWEPSAEESENGITEGFATCLNIRNSNWCGFEYQSEEAELIMSFYEELMEYFGLVIDETDEPTTCENQLNFPETNRKVYWDVNPYQEDACFLVEYKTPFHRYVIDDYWRCVDYYQTEDFWADTSRNNVEDTNNYVADSWDAHDYHQDKEDSFVIL